MAYHLKHGPVKKELIDKLTPYYKELGYRKFKIEGGSIGFEKIFEGFHVFTIYSSGSGGITGGEYSISFEKVEEILKKIKYPGFREGNDLVITVIDKITHPFEQNAGKYFFSLDLFSVKESEDVESFVFKYEEYVNNLIHYLNNEGEGFIEHYSYLPNILKEMDRLESEGKYWSEVLEGGGAYLFKGLIISKLCNDPNYTVKEEFVYQMFHDQIDDWTPYCDKLITYLKDVDPIYNI